jgi:outer membrane receptor protein involved in Fe transport
MVDPRQLPMAAEAAGAGAPAVRRRLLARPAVAVAWWAGLAVLGAVLGPGPAAAQTATELAEMPLSRLLDMEVTGASRVAGRRSESAASVSVLTRAEIEALGWRTLGEALRSLRGTMVVNDRAYDYLGVRGFYASGDYNTRVLLLVDGQRVNDRLYDQAYLGGEFPLEIGEVERIEFIPGQGSAVYGANALFGVVNVITRSQSTSGGSAGAGLGSDGERWWRGHWQQRTEDGAWRLAASRLRRDGAVLGYPPAPEADLGRRAPEAAASGLLAQPVPGLEAERRDQLHARWQHAGTRLSLLHADRRQGVPWTPGVVFGDARNVYRDTFTQLSLQDEIMPTGSEQVTWQVLAGRYRFVGDYVVDYPPVSLNRDIGRGRWWGADLRVTSTRFEGHRLVAGVEWEQAALTQRNFDVEPGTASYLDDERRMQRLAVYAEDQLRFGAGWTLHLGGRLDRVRGQAAAGSPRVALAWRPVDDWHLKAIHGRAFRRANAYEAFYEVEAPGGYRRNPALGPERVRGDELSIEWLPEGAWRAAASLYRNRAHGLLILDYQPDEDRYQVNNTGAFAARGAELEIEHAHPLLRWRLNASYNHDQSGAAAGFPALVPSRQLKGTLVWALPRDWHLGAELQAQARRGSAPGHAVAHVALGGPLPLLGHRPVIQLALRNAFDRDVADPGPDAARLPVLPQPGRRWRLQLDWPLR